MILPKQLQMRWISFSTFHSRQCLFHLEAAYLQLWEEWATVWVRKKEVEQLSEFVKGYISGEELDIRDHREGIFNILKKIDIDISALSFYNG